MGLSDRRYRVRRAVYNRHGLDIEGLLQHRKETGSIIGFPEAEEIDREEALYLECDVLLPARRKNVITSANRIGSGEDYLRGANGPTTSEADAILAEKKIFVMPIFSRMQAGSRSPILSGCRIARGIFGTSSL